MASNSSRGGNRSPSGRLLNGSGGEAQAKMSSQQVGHVHGFAFLAADDVSDIGDPIMFKHLAKYEQFHELTASIAGLEYEDPLRLPDG